MPLSRTLGELAADLQVRLGFGSAGAGAGVNLAIMYNFLYNGQLQLYWSGDWRGCRTYVDKTLADAATRVDYPDEIHPERIAGISVLYNGIWTPYLEEGIRPEDYTNQDRAGPPSRVDYYDQIEFWPLSDQAYSVRIFGQKPLSRFTQSTDETTLDPDLVFLHALANAKAHYKHSDAQFYADQLGSMLTNVRSRNWSKRTFDFQPISSPTPKPQVVGRI